LSEWSASPKSADSVEKVFLGERAKFSRTADVSRKRWREGPHRFKQKRPRTIVSALRGFDAVETSKNQLSRNFRSRSIFDFCNSIGTFRTWHVCDQVLSRHRRGWFDMRDLGAALEREEPLPHPARDQVQ